LEVTAAECWSRLLRVGQLRAVTPWVPGAWTSGTGAEHLLQRWRWWRPGAAAGLALPSWGAAGAPCARGAL